VAALAGSPRYVNILCNPNSPWGLPNVTSDYQFSPNGDFYPYPAWKLNDGLLWYDQKPDNFWTNNQSSSFYSTITATLPRPRTFNSLSLAILADDRNFACPAAIRIQSADNTTLFDRNPWTDCTPNALNTILFDTPSITTDKLHIRVAVRESRAVALSELQIWVPAPQGPRYEAEDGLVGAFLGGFAGTKSGLNATVTPPTNGSSTDGGVVLFHNGWVELADVRAAAAGAVGRRNITLMGSGPGTVKVQMNFLGSVNVTFGAAGVLASTTWNASVVVGAPLPCAELESRTVEVDFLAGGNVVTLFQVEGAPFVDAVVVG